MNRRLPPRDDEWIDREQQIEFRFEGNTYSGYRGDVLSSALWANDVRLQGRSFKYHRPRSIYSLAGHDANVMVEDGRHTNMRGDMLQLESGLDVRSVNTIGGVRNDFLRVTEWFSKFLPVGFYYKAFHTPRVLFPFYENQMRKVAGLGKINAANQACPSPKDYAFCDLLVVGAGPSGLAGAIAAATQGLDVLLVDDQLRPGGSLNWQNRALATTQNPSLKLLQQVSSLKNLRIRTGTQAAGWYADHWVALVDGQRLTKLRARAILVATGCFEQPAVFQNNDLPGVMLGSAAQRLIHLYSVKPFERAVVLTANDAGYQVALDMNAASVDVAAVVDLRQNPDPSPQAGRVSDARIPIHYGHAVSEAVPVGGKTRIGAAVICSLDDKGKLKNNATTPIDCDGIAVSIGWTPNAGLLYQAGTKMSYAAELEQFVPQHFPDGVFAAGSVNGRFDLEEKLADGNRAGLAAAAYLGQFEGTIPPPARQSPAPSHPYPIFAHKNKKNFVDLDEDIHLVDFDNAHQEGYDNVELLKRYTTVGMGPSQGKLSNMNSVRILAQLNGRGVAETGTTTSRPFYQPVALNHLAGRRFHPVRRTSMHSWHTAADAHMMHAGAWRRPEYYKVKGQSRDECILAEAKRVRENLGLIDVGTLGKLEINGPDAAKFLEHIYTGRFAKQQTGRLRYGLACDETGVIIEDGVVARLADDRFYVTATSSGADAFYREMQRWAMIFAMDVVLINNTGQLAAMNLTGPESRQVLQELTDIDVTPDAFPYLGVREGTVAGVPALLMRVGFVGELGYEVHVPASSGLHVWNSMMAAGASQGVRPFGVEAQRLLRLEKGHLIVGQDTDALTNPYEADVAWAIGKNKKFFVGTRSLQIVRQKSLTRQLAGIRFASNPPSRLPRECNLIISQDEIAGRITSVAHHSTLGYPLAMALIRPDLTKAGTKIQVRLEDGSLVAGDVVPLPFYDPDNNRQNM